MIRKLVHKVSIILVLTLVCAVDLCCERAPNVNIGGKESNEVTDSSDTSAVLLPSTVRKLRIGMSIEEAVSIVDTLKDEPRYSSTIMRATFPQGLLTVTFTGLDVTLSVAEFNVPGKQSEPDVFVSKTFFLTENGWELQD